MYWNSLLAKRVEAKYAEAVRTSNLESIAEFSAVFVATVEEQSLGLAVIVTLHELNKNVGANYRFDERFVVRQGAKLRPCEKCRTSSKNLTFRSPE